jgi:Fur family transcriptional regulator, ferric uptake regulator
MTAQSKQDDLRDHGLKATQPRLKVLALFQSRPDMHFSAEDVHHHLQEEHVSLTTIYRVLSQLEAAGFLKRSSFQPEKAIYELEDGKHHDHLVCVECGRIEEFRDAVIERRQDEIATASGFRLVEHVLCIYGVCSACTK